MSPASLPSPETPLYNHPLPDIEQWLQNHGCERDDSDLHLWRVERSTWQAEIWLDIEDLTVRYLLPEPENSKIQRSFKYSLSRQDIEDAIFAGP
jgi:ribosomal protein S4E